MKKSRKWTMQQKEGEKKVIHSFNHRGSLSALINGSSPQQPALSIPAHCSGAVSMSGSKPSDESVVGQLLWENGNSWRKLGILSACRAIRPHVELSNLWECYEF